MTGTHTGPGIGDAIRKGANMVHGTGEAIRGNAMSMVDEATGDKASAAKNQQIANKGVDEWDRGYRGHGTSAGTAPTHTTSTNYGPHDTNMGNKLDPRFDSDTDHRGTMTGSTNAGPHSTNTGNKLDPRIDSDMDHRADPTSAASDEKDARWNQSHGLGGTWHVAREYPLCQHPEHEHRGSIGASSGLEAANKLDPVFPVGPEAESMKFAEHSSIHRLRGSISGGSGLQAAQKLDPPTTVPEYDTRGISARSPGYNQPSPSYYHPRPTHPRNSLDSCDDEESIRSPKRPDNHSVSHSAPEMQTPYVQAKVDQSGGNVDTRPSRELLDEDARFKR